MRHFEQAEKVHPTGNDDAVLRWNRCARLLHTLPQAETEHHEPSLHDDDTAPLQVVRRTRLAS